MIYKGASRFSSGGWVGWVGRAGCRVVACGKTKCTSQDVGIGTHRTQMLLLARCSAILSLRFTWSLRYGLVDLTARLSKYVHIHATRTACAVDSDTHLINWWTRHRFGMWPICWRSPSSSFFFCGCAPYDTTNENSLFSLPLLPYR